jgi:hypothetical protein
MDYDDIVIEGLIACGAVPHGALLERAAARSRRIDSGAPLVLLDPAADPNTSYCVSTAVCDDPACSCTQMALLIERATREADGTVKVQTPAVLSATVCCDGTDLRLGEPVTSPPNVPVSWLRAKLTEENSRQWLRERWRRVRGQCNDPAFPQGQPPEDVDLMVYFYEVFPYDFDLVVTHGQKRYLADDMYCLDPECTCQEALVQFSTLCEGCQAAEGHYVGELRSAVRQPKALSRGSSSLIGSLYRSLLEQYGSAVLRERFRRIRAAARRTPQQPSTRARAKVGRNATCPCGSGKKYKRCCGS